MRAFSWRSARLNTSPSNQAIILPLKGIQDSKRMAQRTLIIDQVLP